MIANIIKKELAMLLRACGINIEEDKGLPNFEDGHSMPANSNIYDFDNNRIDGAIYYSDDFLIIGYWDSDQYYSHKIEYSDPMLFEKAIKIVKKAGSA